MTQTSSKQRCKVDTIGSNGLETLFSDFENRTPESFRTLCIEFVNQSSGKKDTKYKFINLLEGTTSKDKMLTLTTNYILAGQGLGV